MRKKIAVIIVLVTAALVAVVVARYRQAVGLPLSGTVEVADVRLAFQVAGRLEARLVSEGEAVKKGQAVAQLDTVELHQAVARSEAELRLAEAALAELEAGARPQELKQAEAAAERARAVVAEADAGSRAQDLAAALATVEAARAENGRTGRDYTRVKGLFDAGAVPDQEHDRAKTAAETAAQALAAAEARLSLLKEGVRVEEKAQARAALKQAEAVLTLLREGARAEVRQQARARVDAAKAALANARTRLEYGRLASPLSGTALAHHAEPGEYVTPGTPIVTVADLADAWVRVYVPETEVGRVRPGQAARVTVDSFPGKVFEGTVSFISAEAEFTPRAVQTPKERVRLVYRIKVTVRNPAFDLKPGMPADVVLVP